MKDRKELKLLISTMVVIGTVFSLGCIAAADEIDEEDLIHNQTVSEAADEDLVICEVNEVVTLEADNMISDGWFHDPSNGWWYYYVGGKYVTGWKEISGKWYCFESNGRMITGLYYDEKLDDYFLFALDGHMLTGWQRYDLDWMYFGPNGRAAKGWAKIDGKYYYFDELQVPYMHINFIEYDGATYYLGLDGSMRTGWVKWENDWFYFEPSGAGARGWKQFGDKYYYFDEKSFVPAMYSDGIYDLGAGWYGFNSDGSMITGWYNDDVIKVNGKDYNRGNWYYFKPTGSAAVGWTKIGNNWYYFKNVSGIKPTAYQGLCTINNVYYYFDVDSCSMVTDSWINLSKAPNSAYFGNRYDYWAYLDNSGAAVSGWQTIANKKYFFIDDGNVPYMHTGFLYTEEGKYYLGDNGVLRTGWFKYHNDYCYADENGLIFEEGWKEIGGKLYYFRYGIMATGLMYINDYLYDFGTDGACKNPAVG